jgi:hypothetical protein
MTPTIISFGKEGGGAKLLFNGKILKRKKILPPNRGYLAINPIACAFLYCEMMDHLLSIVKKGCQNVKKSRDQNLEYD